jgi:hypothetical protein
VRAPDASTIVDEAIAACVIRREEVHDGMRHAPRVAIRSRSSTQDRDGNLYHAEARRVAASGKLDRAHDVYGPLIPISSGPQ